MQSKTSSASEALLNTLSATLLNAAASFLIFKLMHVQQAEELTLVVTIMYMVIALVRNYGIRRAYNYQVETGDSKGINYYLGAIVMISLICFLGGIFI